MSSNAWSVPRRRFLAFAAIGLCAPATVLGGAVATAEEPIVTVYKSPTCGCCQGWVDYLRDEGFQVQSHDVADVNPIKVRMGLVDSRLASCHTALVGGYVVEGHVPANDIRRLLRERPDIIGITAPGMPQLSPGMMSREPKGYDVLSFDERGQVSVFSRY